MEPMKIHLMNMMQFMQKYMEVMSFMDKMNENTSIMESEG